MKRFCLLIIAMTLLSFVQGVAQDEGSRKPIVYVDYFYRDSVINPIHANIVRDLVAEYMRGTKRIDVVDVDSIEVLREAREKCERGTMTIEDIDERYRQLSDAKVDFVIKGIVDNISVVEQPIDSCTEYSAYVTITLKIEDTKRGISLHAETFNVGGGILDLVGSATPVDAIINACKRFKKKIVRFVEASFPVVGKILEIGKVEDDKVKTLYINLGWGDEVRRGDDFDVRRIRIIAGRVSASQIGRVEIESVEGEHRSLVKVRRGGDDIKKYFDSGEEIVVIFRRTPYLKIDYFNP